MPEESDSPERYQRTKQRTRKADPRLCITGSYKAFERASEKNDELGTRKLREGKAHYLRGETREEKRSLSLPAIQERQSAVKEAKLTVPEEERKGESGFILETHGC